MTQEELDRIFRAARQTKEYCLAELKIDHTSVDQMLRDMQCQINAKIAELLDEVREGEKVESVHVLWKNVPDRIKNPDRTVGYWMVLVSKLRPTGTTAERRRNPGLISFESSELEGFISQLTKPSDVDAVDEIRRELAFRNSEPTEPIQAFATCASPGDT